jgi:hypothetical protein
LKYWQTGKGWRLGWDGNKGLIGSDTWAVEVSALEFKDFCRLATQLSQVMLEMESELADQESVECDLSSPLLYLRAAGFPASYELYLEILRDRPMEGIWSAEAVPELILAIAEVQSLLCQPLN